MSVEFGTEFLGKKMRRVMEEIEFVNANKELYNSLSKREYQIAAMIEASYSISQISYALKLSKNTVNNHKQALKRKINAKIDADIVKFSMAFEISLDESK